MNTFKQLFGSEPTVDLQAITIIKDGTYATIYKKWFNEEPPKLPDAAPLK